MDIFQDPSSMPSLAKETAGYIALGDVATELSKKASEQHHTTIGFEYGRRISRIRHLFSLNKTNDYKAEKYCSDQGLEPGILRMQGTRGWLLNGVVEQPSVEAPGDAFVTEQGLCYKNPTAASVIYYSLEPGIPVQRWQAEALNVAAMLDQLGINTPLSQ